MADVWHEETTMSVTLATIADALIEFILSLLRDPDALAEFEEDPHAALAGRGLNSVTAADVCAVAPVVIERASVAAQPASPARPDTPSVDPVVREVQNIVNNFAWVDDSDTIVDQSVNQNIWADGDVTQVFDQEANVASGDDAIAAGDDVDIDQSEDNSTTITAGDDANVGNDTTQTVVDGSYNETTDASTTTDDSTTTVVQDSFQDSSTTETADESYNSSTVEYTESNAETTTNAVFDSGETAIVDDGTADDEF